VSAANKWKEDLQAWGIPQEIIDQAPESPWIHPPVLFQIPKQIELTPSHQKAIDALPVDGSILDIGCGGGIAAFAMGNKAGKVIGVDHQPEMLEMFTQNAKERHIESITHDGFWPAVADEVEAADVVVSHHVVYNVPEIVPFIEALNSHARKRVVIEMPQQHPRASSNSAWKYFWNLDRPTAPTPQDLINVLKEMGIDAHLTLWNGKLPVEQNLEDAIRFMRIRLCLPANKDGEIEEFLGDNPPSEIRPLATIWWDIKK
jgi:SAM-dependent methyltransferase